MLLNDHVTIISVANTDLLFMNGEQIKNALNNERLAAEIGKKANAEIRGRFSLTESARQDLLKEASADGIDEIIVISTCNRTEIYGFAAHPFELIKLLCKHSNGTVEEFEKVASIYKNNDAIDHMFRVGTGLESQI